MCLLLQSCPFLLLGAVFHCCYFLKLYGVLSHCTSTSLTMLTSESSKGFANFYGQDYIDNLRLRISELGTEFSTTVARSNKVHKHQPQTPPNTARVYMSRP